MQLKDRSLLRTSGYVDGGWVPAAQGGEFPVEDPATGEVLALVPCMTALDARRAIEAAGKALPDWRARTADDRSTILRRWAQLIRENSEDLGMIMTREQGKPLVEARGEVLYGAAFIEWYAEEGKRIYGDTIPSPTADRRTMVLKQPVGVCVGITPWNFPSSMPARKIAPALAAGCTIVVKPAEQTPLSALALGELADRAGMPAGVLSIVTTDEAGAPEIGKEFTGNPTVRKVSFTGSTEVGKLLMEQCAGSVKKVSLELGGSAPFIVFDDAELEQAVSGLVACKFRNSGQMCISANRILVHDSIHDAFVERLVAAVGGLQTGIGTQEGMALGPLIDDQGKTKVQRHFDDAVDRGATVVAGGTPSELGRTFFSPTVVTGVTPDMLLMREETFGPLAGIMRFTSETEAIQIANDSDYGLAAYFYSRDIGRVWRVSEALEFGIVGVNTGVISTEAAPFGGFKESGIGREGSKYGIDEWLEIKHVALAELDR